MKTKRFSALIFGLLFMQLIVPKYEASPATPLTHNKSVVKYAPENPTKEQVKAANPADIVIFGDAKLEVEVAKALGVTTGEITVADMARLDDFGSMNRELSDISGLEYAVNLERLSFFETSISDLTPIANLTSLESLALDFSKVKDISPLVKLTNLTYLSLFYSEVEDISAVSGMTKLTDLRIDGNNVTDLSPANNLPNLRNLLAAHNRVSDISTIADLDKSESLIFADVTYQNITPPDKMVYSDEEIYYDIINVDGSKFSIKLGKPTVGENDFTAEMEILADGVNLKTGYSAVINQKVTYREIIGESNEKVSEEKPLSDEELIDLYEIVSIKGNPITVDQSKVDYETPGTYEITFEDGLDTITVTLVVKDILPTLTVSNETVNLKLGESITDYLSTFGISATEITDGDLTSAVIIDDSQVNYDVAGKYKVLISVFDKEGNEVKSVGNIVISAKSVVVPDEVNSETNSEETNSNPVSKENKSEVKEQNSTKDSDKKMSITNSNKIAKTGSENMIIIIMLSAILVNIIVLKRINKIKHRTM